jgi:endoglucanase
MNSIQIVNNMGIGYNLGNLFDCNNKSSEEIKKPDDQITSCGNEVITKDVINNIKKYGFKTIRFPITWMNFINDSGQININWLSRVREVVNWIIKSNLYCIINIYHDGSSGNWLSKGINSFNKYINLWAQIADEFKNYDEFLIFESMDKVDFRLDNNKYDYSTLFEFSQGFVNTVRNSGGNNKKRLLIISGPNSDKDLICSEEFKLPNDPFNKLAISIHYDKPPKFVNDHDDKPIPLINETHELIDISTKSWGTEVDYKNLFNDFELIKDFYISKGIPVIFSEVGVATEQKKEIESIREYLYAVFSFSSAYNGIMSCLWDTSNKTFGNMNYYDRKNNIWYDGKIKDNFKIISRGKYINPFDFYLYNNMENISDPDPDGNLHIKVGKKTVTKIVFNAKIITRSFSEIGIGISSFDKNGINFEEQIDVKVGKKLYDGSYIFIIGARGKDYNEYVNLLRWYGLDYIKLNYLAVEFEENFTSFDYFAYKLAFNGVD